MKIHKTFLFFDRLEKVNRERREEGEQEVLCGSEVGALENLIGSAGVAGEELQDEVGVNVNCTDREQYST